MQGKYSPTVYKACACDQQWHKKLSGSDKGEGCFTYDADGYDSYGYDGGDIDRAGNHENSYASDDDLFWNTMSLWDYDGTRPTTEIQG